MSNPALRSYVQTLNTAFLTAIPGPSQNPVQRHHQFREGHLQPRGLMNVNNTCCHISLFLSFHRMCLRRYLPPLQNQDYIGLACNEILQALPSPNPFSIQVFNAVWNSVKPGQPIGQHEDIGSLSNMILGSLSLTPENTIPVLTEFHCSYQCNHCTFTENHTPTWEQKTFQIVPLINLPASQSPISVGQLLTELVQSPIHTRCAMCRQPTIGRYSVQRGVFTAVLFNRIGAGNIVRTRLSNARNNNSEGDRLIGDRISIVAHRGDQHGGHYVSYHQVWDPQSSSWSWHLNDDSRRVINNIRYDPFVSNINNETVNMVVYSNI